MVRAQAGAQLRCATPRHEVHKDYNRLPNRTVTTSDQFRLQLVPKLFQIDFTEPSLCLDSNFRHRCYWKR